MSVSGVSTGGYVASSISTGDPILTFMSITSRTIHRYNVATNTWSTITWPATVSGKATATIYEFVEVGRNHPEMIWLWSYNWRSAANATNGDQLVLYSPNNGVSWQIIDPIVDTELGSGYSFGFGGQPGPEGNTAYFVFCCDVGDGFGSRTVAQREALSSVFRLVGSPTGCTVERAWHNDDGYRGSPDGGISAEGDAGIPGAGKGTGFFGQGIHLIGFCPGKAFYVSNFGQYANDGYLHFEWIKDIHFASLTSLDLKTHVTASLGYPWNTFCVGAPDAQRGWIFTGADSLGNGTDEIGLEPPALLIRVMNGIATNQGDPAWDFFITELGGLLDMGEGVVVVWGNTGNVLLGTGYIFRSTNYGATWTVVPGFNGSTTYRASLLSGNAMVMDPTNTNEAYVFGGTSSTVWVLHTTDKGLTWNPIASVPSTIVINTGGFCVSREVT